MRKRNEDGTCTMHGDETCRDPLCGASVLAHELREAETYADADGSNEVPECCICEARATVTKTRNGLVRSFCDAHEHRAGWVHATVTQRYNDEDERNG